MARKTKVIVVCDRHRGEVEAAGSVEFVIDGERRKLDLCAEHLAEVRKAMRPWIRRAAATPARAKTARSRRASTTAKAKGGRSRRTADAATVRAWAKDNGYDVPDRGRVAAELRDAYIAAR